MGVALTFVFGLLTGGSCGSFAVWFLQRHVSKASFDEELARRHSASDLLDKMEIRGQTFDDLCVLLESVKTGRATSSPPDNAMTIILVNLVDQQFTTCLLLESLLKYKKDEHDQMRVLARIEFEVTRMLVARAIVAALRAEQKSRRVDFVRIDRYLSSVKDHPLGLATLTFLRADGSPEEEIENARKHYLDIFPFYDELLNRPQADSSVVKPNN